MNDSKIKVGIVYGGMSAEHEVSIKSAAALVKNIDREKYIPSLIYIDKQGRWCPIAESAFQAGDRTGSGQSFSFLPWLDTGEKAVSSIPQIQDLDVDIYFPILHGPNGEDGKIQGLFEMASKPYTGAGSFASALAMDKAVAKTMFLSAGLRTPGFVVCTSRDYQAIEKQVLENLDFPVFVKPNSLGSSVGISKVKGLQDLEAAVTKAFKFDRRVIIERGIEAREIELSVMGNEEVMVSVPGELRPANEFYDYADKYIDGKTAFDIPAKLDSTTISQLQEMARKAYQALYLNGMSRIDFFIEKNSGEIYINEINTIPGFTEISMFPKLWSLQGIDFTELISRLITYGFEYYKQCQFSCNWNESA